MRHLQASTLTLTLILCGPQTPTRDAQVVDQETGLVEVVGASSAAVDLAQRSIRRLLEEPEEGKIYRCAPGPG